MTHLAHSQLTQALDQLETHCTQLSVTLLADDPQAFERACTALQQLALGFADLSQRFTPDTLRHPRVSQRVAALADAVRAIRQGLLRRAAVVDQALQTLVPAMHQPTYANGAKPYGAGAMSSGRMAVQTA